MPLPLTQLQLDEIRRWHESLTGFIWWQDNDEDISDQIKANVQGLLDESERLAVMLTDCWLVLDEMARDTLDRVSPAFKFKAADLLRKHKTPGWKE